MPSSAHSQAPLGQGDWLPPWTEAEGLLCCLSGIVVAGPPEHLSSFWLVSTFLSFLTHSIPVGESLHRSLWSCWTGSMTAKVCLKAVDTSNPGVFWEFVPLYWKFLPVYSLSHSTCLSQSVSKVDPLRCGGRYFTTPVSFHRLSPWGLTGRFNKDFIPRAPSSGVYKFTQR